jgi:hypothetical protein
LAVLPSSVVYVGPAMRRRRSGGRRAGLGVGQPARGRASRRLARTDIRGLQLVRIGPVSARRRRP